MDNTHSYNLIKRAIKYLLDNFKCQPSLEELASHVDISTSHFQQIFQEWAGVNPEEFLSYLTVKSLQQEIFKTLNWIEVNENIVLPPQSLAYKLIVNIEALITKEYKTLGETLCISYGFAESPFGKCFIATTQKGLCSLQFVDNNEDEIIDLLRVEWRNSTFKHNDDIALQITTKIFSSEPQEVLNLHLKGTPFQINVWTSLLSIPFGSVTSYGGLTQLAKAGQGTRAVSSAVARNPVGYIIPCHRVIRNEGVIGQYHWSSERKATIIGWEKAKINVNKYYSNRTS